MKKNPLITHLSVMCLYFNTNHWNVGNISLNKREKGISDMQKRANHFESLLHLINLGDIIQINKAIKEGKHNFGAWKIGGVQLNAFRTENYADFLDEMKHLITDENISDLITNISGTALEGYIRLHLLKGKNGATEILGVKNFEIETNKTPVPALTPAAAPVIPTQAPMNITIQTESTFADPKRTASHHSQSPFVLMPGMTAHNKDAVVDAKEKLRATSSAAHAYSQYTK